MVLSKFKNVKITGVSAVAAPNEVNIYDEAQYYGGNIKKIDRLRKIAGFHKRRTVEEGTTASDLAIQAGENLIKELNIDKSTIEAVIFVRQRPDVARPATSFFIHNTLGLNKNAMAFDMSLGCTGWMQGMNTAHALIESKACKNVLLLAGDTPSLEVNINDRINAPVFGDGGSAAFLEYCKKENPSYFDTGADGSGFEAIITPASGYRFTLKYPLDEHIKDNEELIKPFISKFGYKQRITDMYMDGAKVFEFTRTEVPKSIKRLLEYANMHEKDIDYLMLHQANKQIIQTIAKTIGFDEDKAPYSAFEIYGNSSVTSIPIAINHSLNKDTKKEKVLCSSFGCGLAWCSGIFNFGNVYFSGVRDYIPPKNKKTRQDWIDYWKAKIKGEN